MLLTAGQVEAIRVVSRRYSRKDGSLTVIEELDYVEVIAYKEDGLPVLPHFFVTADGKVYRSRVNRKESLEFEMTEETMER
jgi:hypothetical protein